MEVGEPAKREKQTADHQQIRRKNPFDHGKGYAEIVFNDGIARFTALASSADINVPMPTANTALFFLSFMDTPQSSINSC
jgi:hypothetical protein